MKIETSKVFIRRGLQVAVNNCIQALAVFGLMVCALSVNAGVISDSAVSAKAVDALQFTSTQAARKTVSVPEPGSILLLGLGLASLVVIRRRKLWLSASF
jgi:hypothetical protein